MVQSLRSGKHMGRKIFGVLMLMAVLSFFLKVSFLGHHHHRHIEKRNENGVHIIQSFKDEWAMAQRVVTETQTSMPTRVLEKFPVSFCLFPEKMPFHSIKLSISF